MERPKKLPDTTRVVMVMPNGGASDKTLKKNVTEIETTLERILKLRPITWKWKGEQESPLLQHGFIAQEMETIFPDLVAEKTWNDGTTRKYIFMDALAPYLVKALQEQQQQVAELSAQLNTILEQRNQSNDR